MQKTMRVCREDQHKDIPEIMFFLTVKGKEGKKRYAFLRDF